MDVDHGLTPQASTPLGSIADAVSKAGSLESLVRPLLEVLETVTGME